MKREREDVTPLPLDCFLCIARADDWLCSGELASTSRLLLRALLEKSVLREIVESCGRRGYALRWLSFALPHSLIGGLVPAGVETLYRGLPAQNMVMSGGAVCQLLYDKEWESDIDCFRNGARTLLEWWKRPIDVHQVSVVCVERVIESFDLSIVQQAWDGVEWWRTPLSLYTQQWRTMIAFPSSCRYDASARDNCGAMLALWTQIWAHDTKCHNGALHRCACVDLLGGVAGHWMKRIAKYARRFPDFTVVYLRREPDEDDWEY